MSNYNSSGMHMSYKAARDAPAPEAAPAPKRRKSKSVKAVKTAVTETINDVITEEKNEEMVD